jgi:PAS domain S-box-containing protein
MGDHSQDGDHPAPGGDSAPGKRDRLRLLLEQLPAIAWTTDRMLRFTSSRGAGLPGLGLEPDEVVGMPLQQFFGTDDPGFLPISVHSEALKGRAGSYEFEWKGRWYQTHVEPLLDPEGRALGTVGVALDITDRKEAEAEILALNRRLTQRQAELATYHDLVTHDLSNLSMTLLGLVERLLQRVDGPLTGEQEELLHKASRQGHEMNRLAENAKLMVRLQEDGPEPEEREVGLRDAIGRALETTRSVHFDRDLDAEVGCPEGLAVPGVPFLESLFVNLLDNAVRHTPREKRPVVRVLVERRDGGDGVLIRVQGGSPPPPEVLPLVFERRVHGAHSSGSGLGLALVREIVERAGGTADAGVVRENGEPLFQVTIHLRGS